MLNYAICQIKGKQYKVLENKPFNTDWVGEEKGDIVSEVLLKATGDKIEIGAPFLKDKITLKNLGTVSGVKIRVAKFHAKANYRRVSGIRPKYTRLVYFVK